MEQRSNMSGIIVVALLLPICGCCKNDNPTDAGTVDAWDGGEQDEVPGDRSGDLSGDRIEDAGGDPPGDMPADAQGDEIPDAHDGYDPDGGGDAGDGDFPGDGDSSGCGADSQNCCGNGICETDEECWSCQTDCGACYHRLWTTRLESALMDPAMDAEGNVIVRGSDRVYKVGIDGEVVWSKVVGGESYGNAPVITEDDSSIIIIGSRGVLYYLSMDGEISHEVRFTPDIGYPKQQLFEAAASATSVIFNYEVFEGPGDSEKMLCSYSLQGVSQWTMPLMNARITLRHPAISAEGGIYIGSGSYLVKYDSEGQFVWERRHTEELNPGPGMSVTYGPSIGPGSNVYIAVGQGALHSFDAEGEERWSFERPEGIHSEPAIGEDGTVYQPAGDGYVYALEPSGSLIWRSEVGNLKDSYDGSYRLRATPLLTADGHVIVASYKYVAVLSTSDGQVKYVIDIPETATIKSSPLLNENGVLYVQEWDMLYAIQTMHHGMLEGGWPRKRGDRRNSAWYRD